MADITAARLNNLQSRIALILGTGSGTSGYGQTVVSSQVNNSSDTVDAEDINNIYTDMVKTRIHQVGVNETGIRQVIADLNSVAEDTSSQINDSGTTATDADGTKKGIADYESLMTQIETDKLLIHASQAALEPKITSTRTATWNGLIFHTFTVTFGSAAMRRHYFNSGGEIRLSSNNTGASTPKGLDWAALCSEIGNVKFSSETTLPSGSGQGYYIGNNSLTAAYQTCYLKTGSGSYSGIYAGNLYRINARNISTSVIEFRVEFNDVVVDNNIDNNVDGTLTSTVQQYRAVGPNSITSISPTYFTSTSLAGFNVPVDANTPTYTLSSDKTTVNEGSTLTLSLNTSNVANGVAVPYAITGVVGSDIGMAPLSGNFIINANGQASLILNITSDLATEGVEALTLALNNGLASVTVTIADTSNSASAYNYDPEWYAEFSTNSWLTGIPKTTAVNIGTAMNDAFFQGTGSYTNNLGQVRYALARKADATGLAYWTKQFYNSYGATFTVGNIGFQRTFFSSVDASTTILSSLGSTQSDAQRTLLATKPFLAGNGNGPFHDRGTTVSVPATPAPPSASFVFTVTPSTGMNFNVLSSYGKVTFYYTIACTAGSGTVQVTSLVKPSAIDVSVDNNSSFPTGVATKSYAMSSGQSNQVAIDIYPNVAAPGTYTGSFAFLEATGVGSNIQRQWGGTFNAG
jgi:hypothetical protein